MKTTEQAKRMIDNLQAEIDRLPEFSAFGDSNAQEIEEMK